MTKALCDGHAPTESKEYEVCNNWRCLRQSYRCGLLSVQTLSTSTFWTFQNKQINRCLFVRLCVYCIVLHSWVGHNVSAYNSIYRISISQTPGWWVVCNTESIQGQYAGQSFKHSLSKRKGGGVYTLSPGKLNWCPESVWQKKSFLKVSGRQRFSQCVDFFFSF